MQELANTVVVLVIISCGLSIMIGAPFGKKMDPFLVARSFGRLLKRLVSRSVAGSYKALKKSAASAWKVATNPRKPALARLASGAAVPVLAIGIIALWLPAEMIGSGKK